MLSHNEAAQLCREEVAKLLKIKPKEIPLEPWDHAIYEICADPQNRISPFYVMEALRKGAGDLLP